MVRRLRCQHADRVLAGRHLLMEAFVLDQQHDIRSPCESVT